MFGYRQQTQIWDNWKWLFAKEYDRLPSHVELHNAAGSNLWDLLNWQFAVVLMVSVG